MSRRAVRSRSALRLPRSLVIFVVLIAVAIGTVTPIGAATAATSSASTAALARSTADPAQTGIVKTSLAGFSAGNIISDAVFTNSGTMTEVQIQSFLNSKVSKCVAGKDEAGLPFVCLKDLKVATQSKAADKYCKAYAGSAGETAARILYKVATACNINPQVLIVMLQKEQGLVTHVWPSNWRYNKAMGQACPDTAPCDTAFAGFFAQVYGAARQMQIYMEGKYFQWYKAGKTWQVLYHPNSSCGTSPVYIANKATEALYYYTPYQPNTAALRANYGLGDSCSSYGNRNFYNYFTDWFGSTQTQTQTPGAGSGSVEPLKATAPTISGYVLPGQRLTATGNFTGAPTSVTYQWYRDGAAIPGATNSGYDILTADSGKVLSVKATGKRSGTADATGEATLAAVPAVSVDRAAGGDREQTAVAASRVAWPSGAKTVYLATAQNFADALAAAPAGRSGGALLLSKPGGLSSAVDAELRRLNPAKVILVGGPSILSEVLKTQVQAALPEASVTRLFGADRYETSRMVAMASGASTSALIATGKDFPDALSAAAAASAVRQPVLLVFGTDSGIDEKTRKVIADLGVRNATIVGGTGVVSTGIEASLRDAGVSVSRLSGDDRYATNIAVNAKYFPGSALKALIASGADFPDALSAAALAGRLSVPMLLSETTCVPSQATEFMRLRGTTGITLIGGPSALTDDGVKQLRRCA